MQDSLVERSRTMSLVTRDGVGMDRINQCDKKRGRGKKPCPYCAHIAFSTTLYNAFLIHMTGPNVNKYLYLVIYHILIPILHMRIFLLHIVYMRVPKI